MSAWQGQGLPPSAEARLASAKASHLRQSLLGPDGLAVAESSGFEPVGVVIGCRSERIDWGEFGLGDLGCGYIPPRVRRQLTGARSMYNRRGAYVYNQTSAGTASSAAITGIVAPGAAGTTIAGRLASDTSALGGRSGAVVYTSATLQPTRSAIERMIAEAKVLGADGVIGVKLTQHRAKHGAILECTASGTAVRALGGGGGGGSRGGGRIFATTLPATDVAKLLSAGWAPVSIVLGMSIGILHDRYRDRISRRRYSSLAELEGLTSLMSGVRGRARQLLQADVMNVKAAGAILTAQMTVSIEEHRVSRGHHDVVAEASTVASSVASLGTAPAGAAPGPLIMLPLQSR